MGDTEILINELEPMLIEIARNDLSKGANIDDHPCLVVLRIVRDLDSKHEADVRQINYMNYLIDKGGK